MLFLILRMALFQPAGLLSPEIVNEAESGKPILTVSPSRARSFSVFSIPVACVLALKLYHVGQRTGELPCGKVFPILHTL